MILVVKATKHLSAVLVALLAATATVTACTGDSWEKTSDLRLIFAPNVSEDIMEARSEGELVLVDGCLGLKLEGITTALVLPQDVFGVRNADSGAYGVDIKGVVSAVGGSYEAVGGAIDMNDAQGEVSNCVDRLEADGIFFAQSLDEVS